MKRLYAGALATIGMLLALGSATALSEGRTDVILAGSQAQVDYHAEAAAARPADGGATIIGGNIQITSHRGGRGGLRPGCHPDPRLRTRPRPALRHAPASRERRLHRGRARGPRPGLHLVRPADPERPADGGRRAGE